MNKIVIFEGFANFLSEVAVAFLPVVVIFIIFQFVFLKLPREEITRLFSGLLFSFLGLALFLQGVHTSFFPVGEAIGQQLGKMQYSWIAIPVGILFGFVATVAEPAVRILTYQVEEVSGGYIPQRLMLYALTVGVALSVGMAITRLLYQIPLLYILIPGYILALFMLRYSSPNFVSIAFDSGGVVTGPMIVAFISAMVIGIASGLGDRDPLIDGFGMIALVSLVPILSVLALGLLYRERSSENKNDRA